MNWRLKRNDKIGSLFFIAFIVSTLLIYQFEERFDKERWQNRPSFRYQMVDKIIESEMLIHKTKDEVINLLGKPDEFYTEGVSYFNYYLGEKPSFNTSEPTKLVLTFINNRVIELAVEKKYN